VLIPVLEDEQLRKELAKEGSVAAADEFEIAKTLQMFDGLHQSLIPQLSLNSGPESTLTIQ